MEVLATALRDGVRRALRIRYVLPWYLCVLLLGLIQSWPLWTAGDAALRNPMLGRLAAGNVDAVVDLFLDNPGAPGPVGMWTLALIPLSLAGGLVYTFFSGGLLSVYAGRRAFWAGCRHFWWSFVGLGIVTLLLALGVLLLAIGLGYLINAWVGVGVGVLGLALLNLVGEYARAVAVIGERRNPITQLALALRFIARHVPGVVALALLATLLWALLYLVYALGARVAGATPALVLVQQVWVAAGLWVKALRLALASSYMAAGSTQGDRQYQS